MSKDYLNEFMILGVTASCVEKTERRPNRSQVGAARKLKKKVRKANKKAKQDRKKKCR